jgi:uncharacterized protein
MGAGSAVIRAISVFLLLFSTVLPAYSAEIDLQAPGPHEFFVDAADIVTDEHEKKIENICSALFEDKRIPVIVATIPSIESCYGRDVSIETFAKLLFNQWGIGHTKDPGKPWNKGVLLLVSVEDRKARIELGNGWSRKRYDEICERIMSDSIIYYFKRDNLAALRIWSSFLFWRKLFLLSPP